jgi:hypothetical protein
MSIREMHPPPLIPRTGTEAVLDAGMPRLDRPRLVNRKLNSVECLQLRTKCARLAAKDALCYWYQHGYKQACLKLRATQIDENFELAKNYPHFKATKKDEDGYIMLKSMLGNPEPVAIRLQYDEAPTGGLTYRQLWTQLREHLSLLPMHSLRICPYRPWYGWMTQGCCVPEHRALPNNDRQCRDLIGTTLVFYSYGGGGRPRRPFTIGHMVTAHGDIVDTVN